MFATINGGGIVVTGTAGLASDNSDPAYGDGSAGAGVQSFTTQLIVHHAYYDDPAVTITGTTNFPIGNNTIVYRAFDMEGNNASCTISVEIADTEPPVINVSTCVDVQASTDPNVWFGTSDACSWVQPIYGSDAANVAACQDAGASCEYNASTQVCANPGYVGGVLLPTVTASDNSGAARVDIVPYLPNGSAITSSSGLPIGPTVLTFVAYDEGTPLPNSDACNVTVLVIDTQVPWISCPANITNAGPSPLRLSYTQLHTNYGR